MARVTSGTIASVLTLSDEQRQYLILDGAPLPLVDYQQATSYILMPVKFSPGPKGSVQARVPGIRAVGEAEQPMEALATLAIVIKENLDRL